MLNFGIRHRTVTVEAESGVAVMTQHSIAGRISKFFKFSIKRNTKDGLVFVVPVDVIYRKKLKRVWSTKLSAMIARANKTAVGHQSGKTNSPVEFIRGIASFLSPFRIVVFLVPFISCITPAAFNFFFGRSPLMIWIFTPNHCAGVATKFGNFHVALETVFTRWANEFTNSCFTHREQTNTCLDGCQ